MYEPYYFISKISESLRAFINYKKEYNILTIEKIIFVASAKIILKRQTLMVKHKHLG
jgi:hypothetical protein